MKKILSILFAGIIALMATACFQEEKFATFDPAQATAPMVLIYNISDKGIQAAYTPGKFNMGFNDKMAVNHKFVIVSVDGRQTNKSVASNSKDNMLTVNVAALSSALVSLGCQEGQTVNLEMAIRASMQNPAQDNERNGYVDSKDKVVVNGFVVTFPKGSPYQEYTASSTWGVTGALSAYDINWNGDLEMFATEDGTRFVAKAVTLKKDDQFKFRKDAAWTENFGAAADVEPFIVSLDNRMTAAGGGKNMAVPADGIYDLWLDLSGSDAVITVTEAYLPYPAFTQPSTWGVTGALSAYGINWNGDLVMTSDGTSHLAQGVKLKKDDQFKFRKDGAWTENFGATGDVEPFIVTVGSEMPAAAGGKNMAVPEDGVYDLIVNPESRTITISETLGGGVSGIVGGDEPEPNPDPVIENAWSVIGSVNGTSWDKDFYMTGRDGIWVSEAIEFTESSEFKVRFNNSWADENTAGAGESGIRLSPGKTIAAAQPGNNMKVAEPGTYRVVFDTNKQLIYLQGWALIGNVAGSSWDRDFLMTIGADGHWYSSPVQITGEFKLRFNGSWADANTRGAGESGFVFTPGEAFKVVSPGQNINVPESATYVVKYDPAEESVVITKQ